MTIFQTAAELGMAFATRLESAGVVNETGAFGTAAVETLEAFDITRRFALDLTSEALVSVPSLTPQQTVGNFGQPPVTLYTDPQRRFFLELYLWSSTDMGIHDHAFIGAFSVVDGVCVNQTFDFLSESPSGARVRTGALAVHELDEMRAGDAREIHHDLTHRNLHLARPTITLVLRSFSSGRTQYLYYEPGLALDGAITPEAYKQLQWLEGLLRLDEERAWEFCERVIAMHDDPAHSFRMIEVLLRRTERFSEIDQMVARAPALGTCVDAAVAALIGLSSEPTIEEILGSAPAAAQA